MASTDIPRDSALFRKMEKPVAANHSGATWTEVELGSSRLLTRRTDGLELSLYFSGKLGEYRLSPDHSWRPLPETITDDTRFTTKRIMSWFDSNFPVN